MLRQKNLWIFLILFCGTIPAAGREVLTMQSLELFLDGQPVSLNPAVKLADGQVLVPLEAFGQFLGAEVKELNGGQLAVCRGDLCIPLLEEETATLDETIYAPLAGMGEALGLSWSLEGKVLRVSATFEEPVGLGIGQVPPAFTLPDLYTNESVASGSFRGKKTVYYMWASW